MSKARLTIGLLSRSACSLGSPSIALAERHRRCRILRHELAELVDLTVGHFQHTADVAQNAARLQGAEGDDLRHLVAAVTLLHVADHLVAPVLAEVDVEVRHRHALGIEESLEQQVKAKRIEVGDGQRVGHERARPRAAARPDRDAMILRPLDEVGNDEEVAGIFHPLDHLQLEGQPLAVFLDGASGREPVRRDTALQARLGARPQLGAFVDSAVADREARQDRLFGERPECATLGDLDRRGQCLRQVGKQRGHLGAAFEIMLGGKLAAVGLGDDAPFRDRNQRVVGVVILALGEERLVGGDEGNVPGIGQLDQRAFGGPLARRAVALQLHVQPVAEQLLQGGAARAGEIGLPGDDRRIERPARPAGERDQAVGCAVEPGKLQMRLLVRRRFEEGPRAQAASGCDSPPRGRPAARSAARRAPVRQASGRASRRRNRAPAHSRQSAGCRSRRAFRRIRAPRTCCRCRSAPAPAGDPPSQTPPAWRWSARLRAANRRNARANVRSRGRRSRDASAIRFQVMVGTQGCCVHLDPKPCRFSPECRKKARTKHLGEPRSRRFGWRGTAVMAREPGKPCFRRHPRPIGDGGYGREYPRQTGMTSGWGTTKTRTRTRTLQTPTNHA